MEKDCRKCVFRRGIGGSKEMKMCISFIKGKKDGRVCPLDDFFIKNKEKGAWRP